MERGLKGKVVLVAGGDLILRPGKPLAEDPRG
jgi:hypothetical protein